MALIEIDGLPIKSMVDLSMAMLNSQTVIFFLVVWDGLRLFNPNLPNIDVEYPVSTKSPTSICGFYGVIHSSTHTIRYGKIHSQLYTQVIRSLLWSMKNWGLKAPTNCENHRKP